MDTYRDHPGDFDLPSDNGNAADDVVAQIGTDERRMHVRAYNYWVSLLAGRDFPSIEDLEPGEVEDFAPHSVLLDFTCGRDNPALPYVGAAVRDECALNDDVRTIADVPSRSLLSRLTDHFMQIIANRAPVGFEAEFENPRGDALCYRGILMPFSSDGDTIDFIYGVINWKHLHGASAALSATAEVAVEDVADDMEWREGTSAAEEPLELTEIFQAQIPSADPLDSLGSLEPLPASSSPPSEEPPELDAAYLTEDFEAEPFPESAEPREVQPVHFGWEDGPLADNAALPVHGLEENAALADRLWAARETAESVKAGEGRTRVALYTALSLAYDFAVAAEQNPVDYAELLEESGMTTQARAPMTPIVKLVFGVDYDKARLTEFAAALSYGRREKVGLGAFQEFIEKQTGGLKGLVAAERQARRPEQPASSRGEAARARLRSAPSISLADLPDDAEFAVIVTRRSSGGAHEAVAVVDDETLIERVIRRVG